jgi:hypothetical protein
LAHVGSRSFTASPPIEIEKRVCGLTRAMQPAEFHKPHPSSRRTPPRHHPDASPCSPLHYAFLLSLRIGVARACFRVPIPRATLMLRPDDWLPPIAPSMRTTFTIHEGVRICVLDFSNITSEAEALLAIDEARAIIGSEPQASVYTLTDVTGSRVTSAVRTALHELTKTNKPYVVAGAVVGVTAIQRVILRGIVQITRRRLEAKNTRAEAMEWLANEAKLDSTKR